MIGSRFIIVILWAASLGACSTPQQLGTFSATTVDGRETAKPGNAKTETPAVKSSSASAQEPQPQRDAVVGNQDSGVQKVALTLSSISDPSSGAYVIGPRDVLEVNVYKVPDLSKSVVVTETGTISYPLVGELKASGRTTSQVEHDLTNTLGAKYLQNPQVNVSVREYHSQRVTMDGAFKHSGIVPLEGGLTLLQATANAGGFEEDAEETVIVFRQTNGNRTAAKYDVSRIREGRDEDVKLEAGDVLIAPVSSIRHGTNTMFKFLPLAGFAIPFL